LFDLFTRVEGFAAGRGRARLASGRGMVARLLLKAAINSSNTGGITFSQP
jgi:hypothetical protein